VLCRVVMSLKMLGYSVQKFLLGAGGAV